MLDSTTQELWKQVSGLRPELRRDIVVRAQDFRGNRWYLLDDTRAGRFLRINSATYQLLGRFDGSLTVEQIVEQCNASTYIGDSAASHVSSSSSEHASATASSAIDINSVLEVLVQLHDFEALTGSMPVSAKDVLRRYDKSRRQSILQRWGNPLSLRFPVMDPDRLLDSLLPLSQRLCSPLGLSLMVIAFIFALLVAVFNVFEIAVALGNKSFEAPDLIILGLMYPFVKALHELGHGLAIKRWGGHVHEAGIFLLVFLPVPYVDGSASWAFREKHRRAIVSGAGILVELMIAAISLLVWALTEPGLINDIALNILLIAGLSTLLYNGNPLLRFDGYYVLEDLLEIPNLASRSARYYLYLFQRYALGLIETKSPVFATGERKWFLVYGLLSPLYRLFVLLAIGLFLLEKYPVIGVLLTVWAVFVQVIKPIVRACQYLIASPQARIPRQRRTLAVLIPLIGVVALLTYPMPLITRSQGIVWIGDDAQITVKTEGFVDVVLVSSGDFVEEGDVLMKLSNTALETKQDNVESRLSELWTRQAIEEQKSRALGQTALAELNLVSSRLDNINEKIEDLAILSTVAGKVVFNDPHELAGKLLQAGDAVAFVTQQNHASIRMVVDQRSIGIVRSGVDTAEVMLADQVGIVYTANIVQETPAAVSKLPSAILGVAGGGPIRTDPTDSSGLVAESEIFQMDLELPTGAATSGWGGRAFVKLYHDDEALWRQWSRRLRQLILSRLAV